MGNLASVGISAADLLADIKHGGVIALALADDDGAVHGDSVHGLAHGLGGHLITKWTISLAHGARRFDCRILHHAQKFQRQITFQVVSEILGTRFSPGLDVH